MSDRPPRSHRELVDESMKDPVYREEVLRDALEAAREFLLRPISEVRPSTGTDSEWTDARQFALWTVEKALGLHSADVQQARDRWMVEYEVGGQK